MNDDKTIMGAPAERKPRLDPSVPTFAIDRTLGRIHVGTSDADVERMVRDAIDSELAGPHAGQWSARIQRQTVKYAIWRHHRNLAEYRWVMGGH